uniref:RNA polymerase I-specific transcription initiation factor RRN6 n=1 Tax=Kwoniella pini CBS 10737 TaxID=1296096 RepID=A0A1B9IBH2_9TREE|nr:uncharacterized protein I206_00289 [Kwoniella pini CBS 10737]OCF52988.1 hypothetical protein I206_00289 [Kwoniella pini CBS 10737]
MTFPSSVEQLPLPRSKRHGRRLRRDSNGEVIDQSNVNEDHNVPVHSEAGQGGPVLDFGRHGGVVLEKGKKGWEWIWANEDREDLRYIAGQEATCLFPPTRVVDKGSVELTTTDLIDSSTKYIESICSPYERYGLREALVSILDPDNLNQAGPSHTSKQRALPQVDRGIYDGSKLAIIHNPRARIAKTLLAFPVGEVGHHLSEATSLLIRLQSTTHLLNLIPDHTYVPPSSQPPILSQRTASLSYEDTEGRRHVDVALDPTIWSRILVVDECGGVWLWWEEKDNRAGRIEKAWNLRKIRGKFSNAKDQFYRIAFGSKAGTALVVSSNELVVIDLDDPSHPSTSVLSLQGGDRQFISCDKTALQRKSHYTALCTNYEVIWVDESKMGTPIISWKHDLGLSSDMEIGVIPGLTNKDSCTILYSSDQQHIMIFPHTKSGTFRSLSTPYSLTLPVKTLGSILPFSPASIRHHRSLLGLTLDGAVHSVPISSSQFANLRLTRHQGTSIAEIKVHWDEHVSKFADRGKDEEKVKKGRELDLRWAWIEINEPTKIVEEDVYFHPDQFEQYIRELDAPFEHLMTASDLAREAAYHEPTDLQSHLLTPLSIHPQAPTATLADLTVVDLARHLPVITSLNHNLPIFSEARPLLSTKDDQEKDALSPANIFESLKAAFPNTKKEDIAQLSLDLSLSRTIVSSDSITLPNLDAQISDESNESDDLFTRAAGLSLKDNEPPEIKFGFLQPKPMMEEGENAGNDIIMVKGNLQDDLTIKNLLVDWKLGENPLNFKWKSFKKENLNSEISTINEIDLSKSRIIKPLPSLPSQSQVNFSNSNSLTNQFFDLNKKFSNFSNNLFQNEKNLPPILIESRSSPPLSFNNTNMMINNESSQNNEEEEEENISFINTQIERGPYGGREKDKLKKKKKDKKRIGGF